MKIRGLMFLLLAMGLSGLVQAQVFRVEGFSSVTIPVTTGKMTNIIFPGRVRKGVKVSREIDARKVKGVDNVVSLRAVERNFSPTNLSVYGMDGRLYSFVLRYIEDTAVLNFRVLKDEERLPAAPGSDLPGSDAVAPSSDERRRDDAMNSVVHAALSSAGDSGVDMSPLILSDLPVNEVRLRRDAFELARRKPFMLKVARSESLRLDLKGVYLRDSLEWLVFDCRNRSEIGFQPVYARYYLEDRKRVRRSAVQEIGLSPVYDGLPAAVAGGDHAAFAIGFDPFTVPPGKRLVVELAGKDGRMLLLRVKGWVLLRGRRDDAR